MKMTVFTGKICPRCPPAKAVAEEVARELNIELEVKDMEEHMTEALQHQIASTPSIMVDNEVWYRGEIPDKQEFLEKLKEKLNR